MKTERVAKRMNNFFRTPAVKKISFKIMKIILFVLFLLGNAASLYCQETIVDSFTIWDDSATPKKQLLQIDIKRDLGLLSARAISFTGKRYIDVRVAIGQAPAASPAALYYVNSNGTIVTDAATPNLPARTERKIVSLMKNGIADIFNLTLREKINCFNTTVKLTEAEPKNLMNQVPSSFFPLVNLKDALEKKTDNKLTIVLWLFYNKTDYDLFQFTWTPEYFYDESALIPAVTPLALLGRLWPVYLGNGNPNPELSPSDLRIQKLLASALAHDLNSLYFGEVNGEKYLTEILERGYYPLSYKLNDPRLALITRLETAGVPYLSNYLSVAYRTQKAINAFQLNVADAAKYDFKDYRALLPHEGTELAKVALRYFTWGVEYTLPANPAIVNEVKQINIFSVNKTILDTWLKKNSATNITNYNPSELKPLPVQNGDLEREKLNGLGSLVELLSNGANAIMGNPLPYQKDGIDSPRTFNYKMIEQYKARVAFHDEFKKANRQENLSIPESTRAYKASENGVISGNKDDARNSQNTFHFFTNKESVNGAYSHNGKVFKPFIETGVDASGFLVGAIAQTSFKDFAAFQGNAFRAKFLDTYFSFNKSTPPQPGLDSEGYPFLIRTDGLRDIPADISTGYNLTKEDIEHSSILVNMGLAQVGDIVIKFNAKNKPMHIGVIVFAPLDERTAETIKVVHVSPLYRQVRLDALSKILTDEGDACHIRRLLIKKPWNERVDGGTWDVMDKAPVHLELALREKSKKDEGAYTGFSDRWIPNTGEYLEFQVLVKLRSEAGFLIDLNPKAFMANLKIAISLLDRKLGPDSLDDASSNIVVNKGFGFELAIRPDDGFEAVVPDRSLITNFTKNGNEYYRIPGGLLDSDGSNVDFNFAKDINSGYYILTYKKNPCIFGIRPLQGGSGIRPGDDIFFSVELKKTDTKATIIASTSLDASYMAVYDKKMLWRANLYVDETFQGVYEEGVQIRPPVADWNDLHSWNAPPKPTAFVNVPDVNKNPAWWSAGWGCNEWNYEFNGETFTIGNGKQTVDFLGNNMITPLRMSGNISAVAYEYPDGTDNAPNSAEEPKRRKDYWFDKKAIDSPFDFFYKMYSQKKFLTTTYANTPDATQVALGSGESYPASGLKTWQKLFAPGNTWMNYSKTQTDNQYKPYLPGVGLLNHSDTQIPAGADAWLTSVATQAEAAKVYGAGADCIGFVRHSADYNGAWHIWRDHIDADTAERYGNPNGQMGAFTAVSRPSGDSPGTSTYNEFIANSGYTGNRSWYPIANRTDFDGSKHTLKDNFTTAYNDATDELKAIINAARVQFMQLVPGDIIAYSTEHIGMIDSVDIGRIQNATSIESMMNSIRIIESVYFDTINYVLKRPHGINENGGIGSWHLKDGVMRFWQIGRLRSAQ